MIAGLITAIRTLTWVPVPGRDCARMATSLNWFPVVGALLGGLLWCLAILMGWLAPHWTQGHAVVVIVGSTLVTRFIHLDGLADWADGFFGSCEREKTLRIMKDPNTGAFGVLALVMDLLCKWVCVTRLAETNSLLWLISAMVLSRTVQVDLAVGLPYARAEGGKAGPFIQDTHSGQGLNAWIVASGLCLLVSGWAGMLAIFMAWGLARVMAYWFRQRIGGVTGDLLGSASELTELGILFFGAHMGNRLGFWGG